MNFNRNWHKKCRFYRVSTTIHIFGWPAVFLAFAAMSLAWLVFGWRTAAFLAGISILFTSIEEALARRRVASGYSAKIQERPGVMVRDNTTREV